MNRLKSILLTGTLVPALALTPIAGAFAQAPDQERHAPGERPEGAPRGAAPPAGRQAPAGREAPPAARQAPARDQAPAREAAPPRAAEPRQAPAPRAERPAAPAAKEERREERREAPRATEKAAPAREAPASRAERPAATPATPPAREERREEKREPPRAAEKAAPAAPVKEAPAAHGERPAATPATPATREERHETPATRAERPAAPAPGAPTPATRAAEPSRVGEPGRAGGPGRAGEPNHAETGPRGERPGAPGEQRPPVVQGSGQGNGQFNGPNGPNERRGGISPGGAAAIGAAAGFAGGFLAATGAQRLDEVRRDRRETTEGGRTFIREPGRTIVEEDGRSYVVHDENDRFRELGYDVRRERRGDDFVDSIDRPDGTRILTYTTPDGRLLRRVRRLRDGSEIVLIDNSYEGRVRPIEDDIVDLPPPPLGGIPRDRYDVAYQDANPGLLYDTFIAPPLRAPPRRYTLDQIRYSPAVRSYVRSVDINTINFDSGSWVVPASATGKLQALADAVKRTVAHDPNTVFLVEGYTDATGNPTDNLSLSDRRAQSVAAILSKDFGVPPENLTTQGYGQQNLKENTSGPSVANRRVVVQNITPLLAAGGQPPR